MSDSKSKKRIKIVSTVLVFSAIALQLWSAIAALPSSLRLISSITQVVLVIHAIEGVIGAVLIALYRRRSQRTSTQPNSTLLIEHLPKNTPLAVVKAGLYAFFVGTVGLSEIISATTNSPKQNA